ncbi:YfhO family protein [bacterium]|nr:YfhO family protein [bacterium]MBU1024896.1 YfhO family protein [bacterium]
MSERKKDIIAVSILLLVIIIRFYPLIFQGYPLNPDAWKNYYPWRADYSESEIKSIFYDPNMEYGVWFPMVKDELANGNFPHWNQYSNCGTPLYANHLVPVFHLPFALALLAPSELVQATYAFIMVIFGTLFFYWFLRNWKLNQFVSTFGALAYFLNGWMFYVYPPEVATFIWLPAILLFHDRFLENDKILDAGLGALCVGQMLIAGYPIHVAHLFYFVLAYFIWRRFHKSFPWKTSVNRWIIVIIIMALGGALISSVQNYPTYKYMNFASRSLESEEKILETQGELIERKQNELEFTGRKFDLKNIISYQLIKRSSILRPNYSWDIMAGRQFTGSVVVCLGLIGLFIANRRFLAIKILFLVFSVLCYITPLYHVVERIVPGWSITPFMPWETFIFLFIFLAALGLDKLIRLDKRSVHAIVITALLFITQLVLLSVPKFPTFHSREIVFRWSPTTDSIVVVTYAVISSLILICIGFASNRLKLPRMITGFCLALFIFSGLMIHNYMYPWFDSKNPMPRTDSVQKIITTCDNGRIARYFPDNFHISRYERQNYIFPPNLPAKFKVMDVFGYDSLTLGNYRNFFRLSAPGTIYRDRIMLTLRGVDSLNPSGFFVQASGLRYCLSKDDDDVGKILGAPIVSEPIRIHRIETDSKPYARFIGEYELISEYDGNLRDDDFTHKILLLDRPKKQNGDILESNNSLQGLNSENIKMTRSNSKLEIEFDAPQDCILYVADTYHPLWRAKLDGEEVSIIEANYAFRAVVVPEGRHKLVMWYDSREVVAGGIASAVTLLVLILLCLIDKKTTKIQK